MDEPLGAEQRQDQYNQGTQGDERDAAPRAMLDFGKGPRLVETKADKKSSGIGSESGEANDPLDAIDVDQICSESVVEIRFVAAREQLLTDKPAVIGVASKVCAVAIGDGERVSRWN